MTCVVLVHGAFRGAWAWDAVADLLVRAGHDVEAPELAVPGPDDPPTSLADWCDQVVGAAERRSPGTDVALVGHSQGGVVVRAAADRLTPPPVLLAYLDAPVLRIGERAVDMGPGGPPDPQQLPPADTLIPPTPLTAATLVGSAGPPESADADDLAAAVNERLRPTPFGPSLEAITSPDPDVRTAVAFCTGTPPGYPCWTTRARMDGAGEPYTLIDAGHDAPITHPEAVARWLLGALRAARPDG